MLDPDKRMQHGPSRKPQSLTVSEYLERLVRDHQDSVCQWGESPMYSLCGLEGLKNTSAEFKHVKMLELKARSELFTEQSKFVTFGLPLSPNSAWEYRKEDENDLSKALRLINTLSDKTSLTSDLVNSKIGILGPGKTDNDLFRFRKLCPGMGEFHVIDAFFDNFASIERILSLRSQNDKLSVPSVFGYVNLCSKLPESLTAQLDVFYDRSVFDPYYINRNVIAKAGEEIYRVLKLGGVHISHHHSLEEELSANGMQFIQTGNPNLFMYVKVK